MLNIASYELVDYGPICLTQANTPWRVTFFSISIVVFYVIPCVILIILYTMISKNLMKPTPGLMQTSSASLRYRKQVILMLGTVVISFFILLLPFRLITVLILFVPAEIYINWYIQNYDLYLVILYTSRILIYLNSAINPILYNLMSSKFRTGFYKLFLINNRFLCAFLFCSGNVARKNTMTNSLVTTTTTNLTSSSIKHQYSISSVHSTQSGKRLSISGRKHAKRHSVVKAHRLDRYVDKLCEGGKRHQCHYCNKQVHVNIEDLTREPDGMEEVDRCRLSKQRQSSDISASCSSGDDEIATHLNPGTNALKGFEETRLERDVKVVESCPVCKIFNKFVTVNNTCDLLETQCTDHKQDEFCKLFQKSTNMIEKNEQVQPQKAYCLGGVSKPTNVESVYGNKARSVKRPNPLDKVDEFLDNNENDVHNPEVNTPGHMSNIERFRIGLACSKRKAMNTGDILDIRVNNTDDKKVLRRRSTYDLFVDKKAKDSVTNYVDPLKKESSQRFFRKEQHANEYKTLKSVSLEKDDFSNSYKKYNRNSQEMSREKQIRVPSRSRSIDEEYYRQKIQYSTDENIPREHKTSKDRSEQDILIYQRDFDNYVYFQSVKGDKVEKLKQQKRVRNSVSLNDSFQIQNGSFESTQQTFEQDSKQKSREVFWRRIGFNYVRNEHKQSFEDNVTYTKTTQVNQVENEAINFNPNDEIFASNEKPPHVDHTRHYFFQKNVQTYQRFFPSTVDSYKHNLKGNDKDRSLQNQIEVIIRDEPEQYHYVPNVIAQPKCSKQNKRLTRRKSFDLRIDREKLPQRKCQPNQRSMTRRKSCDFGQNIKENPSPINGTESSSQKLTTRAWSNELLVDEDLCSIFENPMTTYHFYKEERQKLLQKLDEEARIVHKTVTKMNKDVRSDGRFNSEGNERVDRASDEKDLHFKDPPWSNIYEGQTSHSSGKGLRKKISDTLGKSREDLKVQDVSEESKRKLYHSRSFHFGAEEHIGVHGKYK